MLWHLIPTEVRHELEYEIVNRRFVMSLNKQANRRLWIDYKNDHVQITLIPGKELRITEYESTDEGYYFQNRRYYLDSEGNIYVSGISGGRDCDGCIEYRNGYCIQPDGKIVNIDSGIYDPQAQQAGY